MTTILHLICAEDYHALAKDEPLRPASLASEGFIHCTAEPEVLLQVANSFYRELPGDYLVLVIDPAKVTAPVKYEAPAPPVGPLAQHLFPHIYGPLNRDAIIAVRPARRAADGTFLAV
ncbi:MAG: DUF952 domain-containing protein [Anaerolineales bacterium]|nr:DUF952 domain-containing protein [Anaerolineales bacterium]